MNRRGIVLVDLSEISASTGDGARRARLGLGVILRGKDGAIIWCHPQNPDRTGGSVERFVAHARAGEQRARGTESEVRLFSYPATDGAAATLQIHRFSLGEGCSLEIVQDVTASVRCIENAVERRVLDGVAQKLGHEINNPLAAIFGAVEVLLLGDHPPEFNHHLEVVMTQADRISGVVNELKGNQQAEPEMGTSTSSADRPSARPVFPLIPGMRA